MLYNFNNNNILNKDNYHKNIKHIKSKILILQSLINENIANLLIWIIF
jgi:hypothetical protein